MGQKVGAVGGTRAHCKGSSRGSNSAKQPLERPIPFGHYGHQFRSKTQFATCVRGGSSGHTTGQARSGLAPLGGDGFQFFPHEPDPYHYLPVICLFAEQHGFQTTSRSHAPDHLYPF